MVKRTHPDKGGKLEDQQSLQAAREKWRQLCGQARACQDKKATTLPILQSRITYAPAVLLTYHNVPKSAWPAFVAFLKDDIEAWKVLRFYGAM